MRKRIAISILLTTTIAASAAVATEQSTESVDVEQMQAAIASFGVAQPVSEKAAVAAIEEITQKNRSADIKASGKVSLIPDDLLDISPY